MPGRHCALAVALVVAVATAVPPIDEQESGRAYDGIELYLLSPWNNTISYVMPDVLFATRIPESGIVSLVNRHMWRMDVNVTFMSNICVSTIFRGPLAGIYNAHGLYQFMHGRCGAALLTLTDTADIAIDFTVTQLGYNASGAANQPHWQVTLPRVLVRFEPRAPLPATVPPLGVGDTLIGVTPALPPPSTPLPSSWMWPE